VEVRKEQIVDAGLVVDHVDYWVQTQGAESAVSRLGHLGDILMCQHVASRR
jgi:hypothetical protein